MAAAYNRCDIVRALMNLKDAAYDKSEEPELALGMAALHSAEVLEYLLDRGVDVNSRAHHGNTPLFLALQVPSPRPELVRLLLERGAAPDAANQQGHTPLMQAAAKGLADPARLLLAHGAQLELRDKQGRTALIVAAANARPEMVELLLAHGAQVNAQAKDGRPALSEAVRVHRFHGERALRAAEVLLSKGADIYLRGEGSICPLASALSREGDAIALLLLRSCTDVNHRFDELLGSTPLMLAAQNGSVAVCRELLRRGAEVNAADAYGSTALIKAADGRNPELVRLLLEYGADARARDEMGNTPLRRARSKRSKDTAGDTRAAEVEQLLREHGAQE